MYLLNLVKSFDSNKNNRGDALKVFDYAVEKEVFNKKRPKEKIVEFFSNTVILIVAIFFLPLIVIFWLFNNQGFKIFFKKFLIVFYFIFANILLYTVINKDDLKNFTKLKIIPVEYLNKIHNF